MANTTKPMAVVLFQASVALDFFLDVCMARNIVNHKPAIADLIKPTGFTLPEILGLLLLTSAFKPANSEPNTTGCSKKFKVKKGETCYSTWTRFEVKEKTFYALNSGIDCDNLDIDQPYASRGLQTKMIPSVDLQE